MYQVLIEIKDGEYKILALFESPVEAEIYASRCKNSFVCFSNNWDCL